MTYNDYTSLLERHPYFTFAAVKALPLAPDEKERTRLRRIIAANIGNPADAAEVLGLNSESLADFYPDALPPKLSTIDTIDTFLSTFGNESAPAQDAADTPLHPAIEASEAGIPQSEYNPETPAPADSTTSAIDAFLRAVPPPAPRRRKPQPMPETEETPALTESFARILIKNGNYQKALEIIKELNLKNPEKSVYFADQIRFLKKLILNQSRKNR